jgi:hypothetical protein
MTGCADCRRQLSSARGCELADGAQNRMFGTLCPRQDESAYSGHKSKCALVLPIAA